MQLHGNREQLGFNGKSMYLKIHEDLEKKKERRQESFNQSLWVAELHQKKGRNMFWPQLPANTCSTLAMRDKMK